MTPRYIELMQRRIGVVFVSRRNSLRSVLAEACLAHLDQKHRFTIFSCGHPGHIERVIHPAAVGALHSASIPLVKTSGRGWDELARTGSLAVDLVITLDAGVQTLQPNWPGQPDAALWAYPDIAADKKAEQVGHDALHVLYSLKRRLELLINLPLHGADRTALRDDLRDMAHMR
ncbi:protein-tyrosine-phosphatase [Variovorax boronicumulans]|nr:protein-tyrosine-phosphatase [Variovorax boronicumulans]